MFRPRLSFREHYLCEAIRLLVRADRDLAVGAEYVNGGEELLVDILDENFYGLCEDFAVFL